MADIPEVLFVCTHNAGRCQMAAALLDHQAAGRVRVTSAGSQPADPPEAGRTVSQVSWGVDVGFFLQVACSAKCSPSRALVTSGSIAGSAMGWLNGPSNTLSKSVGLGPG
jgi:hypothetical protein